MLLAVNHCSIQTAFSPSPNYPIQKCLNPPALSVAKPLLDSQILLCHVIVLNGTSLLCELMLQGKH
jgi:hypothetical protein